MPKVLLFDIDNTLLWSGGAGAKAMQQAFYDLFGVGDGLARVEFMGRTDSAIFRDALRLHNIDGNFTELLGKFKGRYHLLLPRSLRETQGRLMPGVAELLPGLREEGVLLGLATGNFREAAFLKLHHYGIGHYFKEGAFGDDREDRDALVALAIHRVANGLHPAKVLVIGDTPLDIAAARANNAVAVAVATGKYNTDELKAVGADLTFPDLGNWQEALATLLDGS